LAANDKVASATLIPNKDADAVKEQKGVDTTPDNAIKQNKDKFTVNAAMKKKKIASAKSNKSTGAKIKPSKVKPSPKVKSKAMAKSTTKKADNSKAEKKTTIKVKVEAPLNVSVHNYQDKNE